ncbi:hypothetical protein BCR39DRAFT_553624 [Naematelia encephala]|uniref:Uncharacterized protein n=1 Tax=Naematelia encephala TaxID=71784 RepID=A0A1Y2AFT7_9TREE|nr:hypothetical protein BCR39DRAFT_553624 [Naematelia encephala]
MLKATSVQPRLRNPPMTASENVAMKQLTTAILFGRVQGASSLAPYGRWWSVYNGELWMGFSPANITLPQLDLAFHLHIPLSTLLLCHLPLHQSPIYHLTRIIMSSKPSGSETDSDHFTYATTRTALTSGGQVNPQTVQLSSSRSEKRRMDDITRTCEEVIRLKEAICTSKGVEDICHGSN